MRIQKLSLLAPLALAGCLAAFPAVAQVGGGVGGGSSLGNPAGGGSTTGGVGTGSSTGSFGTGSSGIGGTDGGLDSTTAPGADLGGADSGLGSTTAPGADLGGPDGAGSSISPGTGASSPNDTNTLRATEGSSSIGEINAGAFARSGNAGTSGATSLGGEGGGMATSSSGSGYSYTPGAGSNADYRIPTPPVGIDLDAIRSGLRNAPGATPKPNGD
ncbi:hypothetical protein U0C82_07660 [Fulvimarina sp. 2208YS6-2-32]|uniref:Uncharacterized protein n=1 Tax=Fulvimarina uroteuthidis TaxID=3098149 RepID=A0ABU5I0W4_9HYPH|nr:hypothetical protein [Fulvimarina sp. 2208YS6-2-32]MDY8109018.1 hypothetical protein [Fulvimarina sp. 2208YS6-2-32]